MNTASPFRTAAVLALGLLAAGAAAQRMERAIGALAPGSVWVNQVEDSGSYGSGRSVRESRMVELPWEGRNLRGIKTGDATLLVQPSGEWVGVLDKDDKLMFRYVPPISFDWPLEVGRKSTWTYQLVLPAQDRQVPVEVRQAVEAYEDVTVPAGTFKTFRVRISDTLGNENLEWFSPELGLFVKRSLARTDRHSQGPGRREAELQSHSVRR